jgi:hypothetical protein
MTNTHTLKTDAHEMRTLLEKLRSEAGRECLQIMMQHPECDRLRHALMMITPTLKVLSDEPI